MSISEKTFTTSDKKVLYSIKLTANRELNIVYKDEDIVCYINPTVKKLFFTHSIILNGEQFLNVIEFIQNVAFNEIQYEKYITQTETYGIRCSSNIYENKYNVDTRLMYFSADNITTPTRHGFRLYREDIILFLNCCMEIKEIIKNNSNV